MRITYLCARLRASQSVSKKKTRALKLLVTIVNHGMMMQIVINHIKHAFTMMILNFSRSLEVRSWCFFCGGMLFHVYCVWFSKFTRTWLVLNACLHAGTIVFYPSKQKSVYSGCGCTVKRVGYKECVWGVYVGKAQPPRNAEVTQYL